MRGCDKYRHGATQDHDFEHEDIPHKDLEVLWHCLISKRTLQFDAVS